MFSVILLVLRLLLFIFLAFAGYLIIPVDFGNKENIHGRSMFN